MANPKSKHKKLFLFLNTSFLFILSLFLKSHLFHDHNSANSPSTTIFHRPRILRDTEVDGCAGLHDLPDHSSKCFYVKTHLQCKSKGYINYLQIFYCNLGKSPILGHIFLVLWLIVLFYFLGDTASNYFCNSLEGLCTILRLSPTIAGVTLLSLGNGAPDFFASIVSFTSSSNGAVGLNSILGGAFFVSSAVLGIITILVSQKDIKVDKACFIRDVVFFLFSLLVLLIIISIGKISLLGAVFFVSIYFLYVCAVSATHFFYGEENTERQFETSSSEDLVESGTGVPLLGYVDEEKPNLVPKMTRKDEMEKNPESFEQEDSLKFSYFVSKLLLVLELPLSLPRKLTIPVVSEDKWSKPYAVLSVTLAPVFLTAVFNTHMENVSSKSTLVAYLTAALIGMVFGNMAFVTTKSTGPPRKCLFPWLAGGFTMSITWTYIIAEELVSLLVSLGNVIGVSPSVLGLTVLAWGNSLGDLIANGAMAVNGGADGAQIAVSGCYAGPMFNTLMGLGFPLVLSAWAEYPHSYVIPKDGSLYGTLLFLIVGLLWALVILPRNGMRLDKSLGAGLLAIYLCFLFVRVAMVIGVMKL